MTKQRAGILSMSVSLDTLMVLSRLLDKGVGVGIRRRAYAPTFIDKILYEENDLLRVRIDIHGHPTTQVDLGMYVWPNHLTYTKHDARACCQTRFI